MTYQCHTHRVEFRLTMPGRASWDNRWSGDGKCYAVVRELSDEALVKLFELKAPVTKATNFTNFQRLWTHRWSDGWCAEVTVRVVPAGEDLAKSDGFHGYEWMVDNILRTGSPYGEVTS